MNSEPATETFNLLSIGQMGVGKTVFLAGSYAELHANRKRLQQLWFDCQDRQAQENIERLLSYTVQTGKYPPATMKVTNFNFSLKRRSLWGVQTLCYFRWWDIPGEICNIHNRDFRSMVSNSQGCCVFIDAYMLVHNKGYLQALEDIIKQVMAIASLIYLNDVKYPFALILTKCDLLEPGPLSQQQLEKGLQLLTTRLDAVRANYQTFYSLIPIVRTQGASTLRAKGAAAPLLWLVGELSKPHNSPGLLNSLLELVTRLWSNSFQSRQEGVDGSLQRQIRPADKAVGGRKILGLYLLPSARRNLLLLALAIVALVGVIALAAPKSTRSGFLDAPYDRRERL
jgi:GTPase SAR1 family protein